MYTPRPHDIALPPTASIDLTEHVRLALDVAVPSVAHATHAQDAA